MQRARLKRIVCGVLLWALIGACSPPKSKKEASEGLKIVSLAPSVTEFLYKIGVREEIVGLTEHCQVPEGVDKESLSLGGMDPSIELIISRQPDIIFTINDRPVRHKKLRSVGIRLEKVESIGFEKIMASFTKIGTLMKREKEAAAVVDECREALKEAEVMFANKKSSRVLLCISTLHDRPGNAAPWIAGTGNMYSHFLKKMNMTNVYQGDETYLRMPMETLLGEDPDVILVLTHYKLSDEVLQKELQAWKSLPGLTAVRNNNLFFLGGDFMMLAGPRIPMIIEEFKKALGVVR